MTILPDSKTRAVVLGSRRRMVTAEKRLGLYLRHNVKGAGGGKDDTEGVALGVAHLHGDAFEVNAGSKVDRRNYVL